MHKKGIIFALIIFIALGLYVFLVEKKRPIPDNKEIVLKFDKDKVQRLVLVHEEKEIVLNKDKERNWQITSPIFTKADDGVVEELVKDLSSLEAYQSLEVDPSEWQDFGLKKPEREVSVLIDNRKEKLSFGDKNPAGTSIYARMTGKDKIFLVSSYAANSFKKDVFELRNKIILSIDKEKVEKIELIYPGKGLVLEREKAEKDGEEDKWFLSGKERVELDSNKINGILRDITDIRAKGFVSGEIKDPSIYGLDKPDVKVVIKAESKENTLFLGQKATEKKDTIYASLAGDLRLFLVPSDLSSRLTKDLSDLKKEEEKEEEKK